MENSDKPSQLERLSMLQSLSLRRGMAAPAEIDQSIRSGVDLGGTNLWVLFFAILIACLGLNLNASVVIIGAMLISPLMGPVVGVGYGLAVHDMALVVRGLRNLLIFAVISLVTSALYFSISPLSEPGSELLARTSPALWDVLIAFFGGAAGIIAITRKRFSNVVPGVALATALMTPLCTAGYALVHGRWNWLGGALYLFAINSVFIAYATLLFSRFFRLHRSRWLHGQESEETTRRAAWLIWLTLIAMTVPSIYLGWRVVQTQRYTYAAQAAIDAEVHENALVLIHRTINAEAQNVQITFAGDMDANTLADRLKNRLIASNWTNTQVQAHAISNNALDMATVREQIQQDLASANALQAQELKRQLALLDQEHDAQQHDWQLQQMQSDLLRLKQELLAQYPQFTGLQTGWASSANPAAAAVPASAPAAPASAATASATTTADGATVQHTVLIQLPATASQLPPSERERLLKWLQVRLAPHRISLAFLPQ